MNLKPLIGLAALAAVGLAACGGGSHDATPASAPPAPTATTVAPAAAPPSAPASAPSSAPASALASITLADSPLGRIMVDAQGRTLYALTNDKDGTSTCTGACANAWPAASITGDPIAGDGVTVMLTTVDNPAGGKMLKAGKWPLYRFAGDAAPGDTNGQGSGGVWFVVGADGKLIKS